VSAIIHNPPQICLIIIRLDFTLLLKKQTETGDVPMNNLHVID